MTMNLEIPKMNVPTPSGDYLTVVEFTEKISRMFLVYMTEKCNYSDSVVYHLIDLMNQHESFMDAFTVIAEEKYNGK